MHRHFRVLLLLCCLGVPLRGGAQNAALRDTVWLRLTVHWDSASGLRERSMPLQLAPAEPGTPFADAWFRALRRSRQPVFADAAHRQPQDRHALRRQLRPYRHWLRKPIRYRTEADNPANFYLALDQQEVWQPGRPRQVIGHRVSVLRWDSAAPPLLAWYLPPQHPALRTALPHIRAYRDYGVNHDLSVLTALDSLYLNDQALTPVRFQPPQPVVPAGMVSRRIRIRIPSELTSENSLVSEPVTRDQQQASAWLVGGVARALLPAILTRQLPMYYWNVPRKLPRDQAATLIRRHPANAGDPTRRRDARTLDFSAGVVDLQVGGVLTRSADGRVQFAAEDVELVWRDDSLSLPVSGLGIVRLADVDRLGLQVQGRPLRAALSELAPLYWYLLQVNDYSPQTLPASFDLRRRLWSGDWAGLPNHAEHEAMVGQGVY